MNEKTAYIYGRNSIIETIESNPQSIEKIFVSFNAHGKVIDKIFYKAKKNKVKCIKHDKRKFSLLEQKVCPKITNSQGVIALLKLVDTLDVDELINLGFEKEKNPVIIALDNITDPHNLGAIARTAECSGASGIIVTERNSSPITPTAIKTSAGALEHLPIAKVNSLPQILQKFKDKGFWVVGTEMDAKTNYTEYDFLRPVVVIIGNEGKGISPSVSKQCDDVVNIPIKGKINSLNASVSAGIILYEIVRQKKKF